MRQNLLPFLRTLCFYMVYTGLTITFGCLMVILQFLLSDRARINFLAFWNVLTLQALRWICGVRYRILGKENIPKDKPFVVLANHQSQWETYCLCSTFTPISIILKKELLKIPVFGWCLAKMKPIAIDRADPRQALKDIQQKGKARILEDQLPVLIFPEGTRQPVNQTGKFSRSGAQLALQTECPVLFVAHNSGTCWNPNRFIKTPGLITVSISELKPTAGLDATTITREAKLWIDNELSLLNKASSIQPSSVGV